MHQLPLLYIRSRKQRTLDLVALDEPTSVRHIREQREVVQAGAVAVSVVAVEPSVPRDKYTRWWSAYDPAGRIYNQQFSKVRCCTSFGQSQSFYRMFLFAPQTRLYYISTVAYWDSPVYIYWLMAYAYSHVLDDVYNHRLFHQLYGVCLWSWPIHYRCDDFEKMIKCIRFLFFL